MSVISFALIFWLLYSEVNYYLHSKFIFKFSPDIDYDEQLKINIDITVAMPCAGKIIGFSYKFSLTELILEIGADILDSTNQNTFTFGMLYEEDTWFNLAPNQQYHFENKKHFNSYLREEYHAIQVCTWLALTKYITQHCFKDFENETRTILRRKISRTFKIIFCDIDLLYRDTIFQDYHSLLKS